MKYFVINELGETISVGTSVQKAIDDIYEKGGLQVNGLAVLKQIGVININASLADVPSEAADDGDLMADGDLILDAAESVKVGLVRRGDKYHLFTDGSQSLRAGSRCGWAYCPSYITPVGFFDSDEIHSLEFCGHCKRIADRPTIQFQDKAL